MIFPTEIYQKINFRTWTWKNGRFWVKKEKRKEKKKNLNLKLPQVFYSKNEVFCHIDFILVTQYYALSNPLVLATPSTNSAVGLKTHIESDLSFYIPTISRDTFLNVSIYRAWIWKFRKSLYRDQPKHCQRLGIFPSNWKAFLS